MSTADEALDRDLRGQVAKAAARQRCVDLVARCIELATAVRVDDRAWALFRLAADLRQLERCKDALHVLDLATALPCCEAAELAAYTCAIAVHCDRADYDIAVKLERQAAALGVDLKFARVCCRLYSELFALSEDEEHRSRCDAYGVAADALEPEQSIAT